MLQAEPRRAGLLLEACRSPQAQCPLTLSTAEVNEVDLPSSLWRRLFSIRPGLRFLRSGPRLPSRVPALRTGFASPGGPSRGVRVPLGRGGVESSDIGSERAPEPSYHDTARPQATHRTALDSVKYLQAFFTATIHDLVILILILVVLFIFELFYDAFRLKFLVHLARVTRTGTRCVKRTLPTQMTSDRE